MEFVQIRKRHFSSIGEKTGYEESIVERLSHANPSVCSHKGLYMRICTVP